MRVVRESLVMQMHNNESKENIPVYFMFLYFLPLNSGCVSNSNIIISEMCCKVNDLLIFQLVHINIIRFHVNIHVYISINHWFSYPILLVCLPLCVSMCVCGCEWLGYYRGCRYGTVLYQNRTFYTLNSGLHRRLPYYNALLKSLQE